MYQTKTCQAFALFCTALIAGGCWLSASPSALANLPTVKALAKPPTSGKPGGLSPGGSRPPDCLGKNNLYSLTPRDGGTATGHPIILVYVPPTDAVEGRFVLKDENNQPVYTTQFALKGNAINGVPLPPGAFAGLEVGKRYEWIFSVTCDAEALDTSPSFKGWITRGELDASTAAHLAVASPLERISLYQQEGLWYDGLGMVAELRRSNPYDRDLIAVWTKLLKSAGLDEPIIAAPLF
ncbi:DUF928 domain-containing protein [Leptothermofonsia sichuanensis E412]|uniref:DUF928 domain-containing protein n=1 Tax=Leptothermofonsia sichuanensis TaxID=2917832 RepID=UPI001CA706D9|nr:DUF928 domain-containing protein [Leptothermofonsia sichuanensis]QZZ21935.1 DUF928 domain-containing protein [Leptothermofonsia sichuanensis E412]